MTKSCFLVPIHNEKFIFGYNLIDSFNLHFNDQNLFFCFSNCQDYQIFKSNCKHDIKYIICEDYNPSSIVTTKKYYGLNYIFNNTDFNTVAVFDVDTLFIKNINYNEKFQNYINSKKIYGNYISGCVKDIISSPTKFFSDVDKKVIREITKDYSVYFWFNDIPIFTKKHFLNFLEYIDYKKNKTNFCWNDFDFIVYAYYLFLTQDFKLDIVSEYTFGMSYLEQQYFLDKYTFSNILLKHNPMWIRKEIDDIYMKNVFMKFHVDRRMDK